MHIKNIFLGLGGLTFGTAMATQPRNRTLSPSVIFQAWEPLLPSIQITAAEATHPDTYSDLGISTVKGFFDIKSRLSNRLDPEDLRFDYSYTISISPALYNRSSPAPSSERWEALEGIIERKNTEYIKNSRDTRYKVLFLARHGQGYHNVAEEKYRENKAWECYWAMQAGDEDSTWGPDAKLTPHGIAEAKKKGEVWRQHIEDGAPIPERHFVSPLSRSIRTMEETWKDVYGWLGGTPHPRAPTGVRPVVKELLRETMSLHYSDHRSSLNYLYTTYPYLIFSPQPICYSENAVPFPNEDPFWNFHRESMAMRDHRIKTALQEIIAESGNATYIGVTAHFGVIESALTVLGGELTPHLGTTGVVPVVVKVEPSMDLGRHGVGSWWEKKAGMENPPLELREVCPDRKSVV